MNRLYRNPLSVNRISLLLKVSDQLPPEVAMPSWAFFAKLSSGRENSPIQRNWWNLRTASVLVKLYVREGKPVGQRRLSRTYTRAVNRGTRPNKPRPTSRKILRTIFRQLEAIDFVRLTPKGREISPLGKSFLSKMTHGLEL